MKMAERILIGLAMAGALAAQTAATVPSPVQAPEPPREQRVFVLKYADARAVANVLGVFGYGMRADRDLRALVVSAPAATMAAVEEAIKRLDVPEAAPRDIDLVGYMVVASEQSSGNNNLPPRTAARRRPAEEDLFL